ncbi:MAG: hypothetical protein IT444_06690 [Phycisphaeraceae bacterium]|nr:hypothetical protein [Phycisphaeraceae bacterium]
MLRFFTYHRVLAGIVFLLLVGCFLKASVATAIARGPAEILRFALSPFTHKLTTMSNAVRGRADLPAPITTANDLQQRVWALERLNEQLLHDLEASRAQLVDISALRRIFKPIVGTPLPVDVVAAPGGSARGLLTINHGARSGIVEGAVVVSGEFLVGRVAEVGEFTSVVRLLSAPMPRSMPFEVRIIDPNGVVRQNGAATASPDGKEFWIETAVNATQIGDVVRMAEQAWPSESRGFIVGKVTRREKLPNDPFLRERVIVEPIRELDTLDHVQVLLTRTTPGAAPGPVGWFDASSESSTPHRLMEKRG